MNAQAAAQTAEQDTSYDEVPYESYAYPQTHPQHLSTVATLFGMTPPDFKKARVLEIGCAAGGNLFSQALMYPEATYLGVDLSQEQIAQGQKICEEVGIKNITLRQENLLDFDTKKNKKAFDYIICHGVYSWVPENVREKILEVCKHCLSDDGLAVVSYNTLPGWNAVRSLREMMLFHTRRFTNPQEKIGQAKALLDFLAENVPQGQGSYRSAIEEERNLLKNANDTYFFHDHLEEMNTQFYFHEFIEAATRYDLNYVGDSNVASMFVGNMPKGALEKLQAVNDIVSQEQYMDFIANRRFRISILCKKPLTPKRQLDEGKILNYYLSAAMKPHEDNQDPKKPINFVRGTGNHFTSQNEVTGTLFLELCACGSIPVHAEELIKRTTKKLGRTDDAEVRATLVKSGLRLALRGFINLFSDAPTLADGISKKPVVFALARHQAAQPNCRGVTNVIHNHVGTNTISAIIVSMFDGTRTMDDVVTEMIKKAQDGTVNVQKDGKKVTDEKIIRKELESAVKEILDKLLNQGLLVG